ncbi:MAG: zinc-binding dehydrogenase [Kiritimatiellae bacterium]|nr:zinc-binding dehydrogenase [Kiritimatiellia bacterium]
MTTDFNRGKAIILEKPKQPVVKQIDVAPVDDETVVIETKFSGISTGTEMAVYAGRSGCDSVYYPCVPGYEEVGEVVYVGKNAVKSNTGHSFKVGDRAMANEVRRYPNLCAAWGGQTQYAVKNPTTCPPLMDRPAKIPDNVSYEEAAVTYLACVAKKGIDRVGVQPGETVLVIGMGNIGLSAVQLARLAGAERVIAADVHEGRLDLATKYADRTLNFARRNGKAETRLLDLNDGKKADVVIECSGNPSVIPNLPLYVRPGGRIHLQGQYRDPIIITQYNMWNNNDLTVSCSIAMNPGNKEEVLQLIADGKFDAKSLVTKTVHVDDAPAAYKELEENGYDILKILINWEG